MRDDAARYHLMASVHHAAKANAYGKLGYRGDQMRHAARALDHRLMFGAGYDDPYDDDPDTRELGRLMKESHGSLYPEETGPSWRKSEVSAALPPKKHPVVYTPTHADDHAPYAPIRVSSLVRRVPIAPTTVPFTPPQARRSRGPTAPRVQRSRGPTAAPHAPLHGTPVGVYIKPADFFKAAWHREILTRELKKLTDLRYLNNGKPVTIHTPMPDYVLEPIVEKFLPPDRLRAWHDFVETTQSAYQRELDAPELD
jgi:hypothetical protein